MTPSRWGQVSELFHAALERPPPEQRSFLVLELARAAKTVGRREDADALLTRAREAGSLEPFEALSGGG
jgi:uncharacterized protein HemY